jgi:hypothetical protein
VSELIDDEEKVYPAIGADLNPLDCQPPAALDGKIIGARAGAMKGEFEFPGDAIFFEGAIYWRDDGYHRSFVPQNDRPGFDEMMKNFIEQLRAILLHPNCDRARVRAEFEKLIQAEGAAK